CTRETELRPRSVCSDLLCRLPRGSPIGEGEHAIFEPKINLVLHVPQRIDENHSVHSSVALHNNLSAAKVAKDPISVESSWHAAPLHPPPIRFHALVMLVNLVPDLFDVTLHESGEDIHLLKQLPVRRFAKLGDKVAHRRRDRLLREPK